ncbi:hypothetical protein FK216_11040 [Moraxellaceae bacterium AER2_44_116]|nr:hypothetical protein FK216_11040 [Moraxellaceae bacterium AER2_44_116]
MQHHRLVVCEFCRTLLSQKRTATAVES